jgi:hypothetical protein
VGEAQHNGIRLCDRGGEGGCQWTGSCATPGDRARAVAPASGSRGGGGNSSQVDAASRGKVAAAVQS